MTNSTVGAVGSAGNIKYSCDGFIMKRDFLPNSNGSWESYNKHVIANESGMFSHPNMTVVNQSWDFPAEEISNLILYSAVFLLAVVGNILAIITLLANTRMRTVASCFLLSLSISDLLLAIVCMPISLTGRILKRFIFGRIMCKVMPLLMGSSVFISTFTMLAISVERYYAICKPLKSRSWQTVSHAYKVIVAIWIASCILSLPYAIISDVGLVPLIDYNRCTAACRLAFTSRRAKRAWYLFLLLMQFCVPGVLMTIAYTRVSCRIWKEFKVKSEHPEDTHACDDYDTSDGLYIAHRRSSTRSLRKLRSSVKKLVATKDSHSSTAPASGLQENKTLMEFDSSTKTHSHIGVENGRVDCKDRGMSRKVNARIYSPTERLKAKKKVVRMLIVIVILFFVCWTPLSIVNVWKAFDPDTAREKLDGIIEIIQLMSYISTCVNPLVYCFMNKRFRSGFLKAFLICVPGKKNGKWNPHKTTTIHTKL